MTHLYFYKRTSFLGKIFYFPFSHEYHFSIWNLPTGESFGQMFDHFKKHHSAPKVRGNILALYRLPV